MRLYIRLWAALLLGAALLLSPALAGTLDLAAQPACRLQIIPDYTLPVAYKAVHRLSPGCAPDTVLRVHKTSTLTTKGGGSPVQPVKPAQGAWEVGRFAERPVPTRELWTLYSWVWRYWDAQGWNTLTGRRGLWRPAEVLRALP